MECKDCEGSQICQHQRQRSKCKDCGGGSICIHQRRRSECKECVPKGYLAHIVENRVRHSLQSDKELSSQDYLGCDMATFRAHFESQFKEAMS